MALEAIEVDEEEARVAEQVQQAQAIAEQVACSLEVAGSLQPTKEPFLAKLREA